MFALQTYGLCLLIRTGTRTVTSLILRTRTLSDMVALDKRLYTSHHATTDSVSRLEPDRVKLARNDATEFIELYVSTTPMHSSHCSKPHTYPSPGRTCTYSVSAIAVENLLLS